MRLPQSHPRSFHSTNASQQTSGKLLDSETRIQSGKFGGEPHGIQVVHDPEDPVVDIIFIHGLTGNRHDTWTKNVGKRNECFWPQDLLAEDIPNARIATWGYDADIVHGLPFHAVSTNTLQQHSGNLCGHLANLRSTSEHKHPILFIAHSLGGLVCKSALLRSSEARARGQEHIRDISLCTRGIIFMGTPHQGSTPASWAHMLASMIRLVKHANADIVKSLEKEAPALAELQQRFYTMLANCRDEGEAIDIICYHEELPMAVLGMIVPSQSAQMVGYPDFGIHADHRGMTKFGGDDSPGYVHIRGELQRWLKKWSSQNSEEKKEIQAANMQGRPSFHTTFSGDNNQGFQAGYIAGPVTGYFGVSR